MGHKEVGGVKAQIDDSGKLTFVLEQLEVDWKYTSDPVQTADNEIAARIIVREVFRETASKLLSRLNQSTVLPVLANIPILVSVPS